MLWYGIWEISDTRLSKGQNVLRSLLIMHLISLTCFRIASVNTLSYHVWMVCLTIWVTPLHCVNDWEYFFLSFALTSSCLDIGRAACLWQRGQVIYISSRGVEPRPFIFQILIIHFFNRALFSELSTSAQFIGMRRVVDLNPSVYLQYP